MPAGRPTKYKPEMCEQLVGLMADGLSKTAACVELGITTQTLYRWGEEKPEFSDAIKKGEEACSHWWECKGRDAVQGEIEGFNATAYVWMTKNILNWRDKQEVTGKDGEPLSIEIVRHAED